LNVLNEAEINYKAARNKRLHVELALIKLCYLQQALELQTNEVAVIKKKRVGEAKPVAFRQIAPMEIRSLKLGTTKDKLPLVEAEAPVTQDKKAKLIIESQPEEKINVVEQNSVATPKLEALNKIRDQFKINSVSESETIHRPLVEEELEKSWMLFVRKLKDENNSAAESFELSVLRIKSENCIEVIVSNNLQQKFIEKDRTRVCGFLQQQLNNKFLQLSIVIEENLQLNPKTEAPLTAREQFLKITEQYPLVKELKDRLRLELDY